MLDEPAGPELKCSSSPRLLAPPVRRHAQRPLLFAPRSPPAAGPPGRARSAPSPLACRQPPSCRRTRQPVGGAQGDHPSMHCRLVSSCGGNLHLVGILRNLLQARSFCSISVQFNGGTQQLLRVSTKQQRCGDGISSSAAAAHQLLGKPQPPPPAAAPDASTTPAPCLPRMFPPSHTQHPVSTHILLLGGHQADAHALQRLNHILVHHILQQRGARGPRRAAQIHTPCHSAASLYAHQAAEAGDQGQQQ